MRHANRQRGGILGKLMLLIVVGWLVMLAARQLKNADPIKIPSPEPRPQAAAQELPARPDPKIEKEKQIAELMQASQVYTAEQLVVHYKANEIKADEDLKGKWFKVSGKIEAIGKDILGNPYVALAGGRADSFRSVQCTFADASKLSPLKVGQTVTIFGKGSGLMMHVQMSECRLIE